MTQWRGSPPPPTFDPEILGQNLFNELKKILPISFLPLFLLITVLFLLKTCFIYIKPNEYGVKQVNIGIKTGIQETIYQTGFHFVMPLGLEIMHRLPRDLKVFEMTNYDETASLDARREKAAHIQTSDGFFVDVDVSIIYHITDPYKVITSVGPGQLYEDNGIVPKVEPKLKEALGEMTTEEFYNSPLRVAKSLKAKDLLNTELTPKGIIVDNVLVRYFKYSDEIQRNIEEKKLKDQLVFTNQSKAKASGEEALVKKVRQEGVANVQIKLEEGKAYIMKRNAERDLYVRTKRAEGDLLINLSEAKKTELVNQAYQKQGSDKLIGLKMAEVYKGLSVIMLPSSGQNGFNPLDLDKSLQTFGVLKGKE